MRVKTLARTMPFVRRPAAASRRGRIVAFATQGGGGDDEVRLRSLLADWSPHFIAFDRRERWRSFRLVLRELHRRRPDLVVMEGSGIAGGLALILAKAFGVRYVVSSGDAVGPFIAMKHAPIAPLFALYERLLCRCAAGFIGWTPYLCGRALTFGAPRAMTAPGWAPFPPAGLAERLDVRRRLGIPMSATVFGIVGRLDWSSRRAYCYGLELVRAMRMVDRDDVRAVIVGDGDGRDRLAAMAAGDDRIVLTGQVPREEVPAYLAAMDIASLPQSADQVGSFRYTTKLSEYMGQALPVVTGQLPLAYDLDDEGWMWRLPGNAPWEERYLVALADLMSTVSFAAVTAKKNRVPQECPAFSRQRQTRRVNAFLEDLLAREGASEPGEGAR